MLQFLCIQNIETVLESLGMVFQFSEEELFLSEQLFEMTKFPKVLHVLSLLSQTPIASSRFKPFPENNRLSLSYRHREEEEDIYRNLPDLASDRDLADEEDLYDSVADAENKEEEEIYGSLIAPTTVTSPTKDRRSCCVSEILETERNYVQHLNMMLIKFKEPLQSRLTIKDIQTMFMNMDVLHNIHKEFFKEIERAKNDKLSQPFLKYKDRFLVYGEYCSSMTDSQDLVEELMKSNETMRLVIEDLQNKASPSKFKLRELVCVPMQRVLKYHLLIKELNKHTPDSHPDKKEMQKALEAMQELSHYVNEVKRDSEMLITINKVESCLTDYNTQSPLYSYGRLLKDGELKIKGAQDKNPKARNTFLFDQALFMTKADKGIYCLKDLLRLEEYRLDETLQPSRGGKWSWSITLYGNNSGSYVLYAKTELDRSKWLEGIKNAFDNINPHAIKSKQHHFKMQTFSEATYCNSCNKLLLGTFYQGYICQKTNAKCHKTCLADTLKKIENQTLNNFAPTDSTEEVIPQVPQRGIRRSCTVNPPEKPSPRQKKSLSVIGTSTTTGYKAHRDYNGLPPPPFVGASVITFAVGEMVEVSDKVTADWWVGSAISQFDRKGYFPASYVSPMGHSKVQKQNYLPVAPNLQKQENPVKIVNPSSLPLEECPWYAGIMDRGGAEQMLGGKPSGTFLVRTRDGHMAISLCFQSDMKHIRINITGDNMYFVAECKNFRTVQELVRYYQDNSMSSSFFGLETNLKYPYRDPKFFPARLSQPIRPEPPSVPKSFKHPPPSTSFRTWGPPEPPKPNMNSVSNGIQQINFKGRTFDLLGRARVLYDFDPRSAQEIALREGQIVNVISKAGDSHGWWKGEHDGQVGYFPASFIEELE
uniref:Guanine nucleotide exchange factor VAV2-like n=1 Tax=Phallusia mammillata TaxID=59560 RepID=A0A6F9DX64_9ASCI|nr:guanine nucleotide exchange factor VAV2-like [Phallusia mammillata]